MTIHTNRDNILMKPERASVPGMRNKKKKGEKDGEKGKDEEERSVQAARQCYDRSLFRHTALLICRAVSDLADRDTEYPDQYYKCSSECSKECGGGYGSHPRYSIQ